MIKFTCCVASITFPFLVVAASFGSLVSSETSGQNKYCKYSNGVILTVKSYEVCPTTVQ